RQAFSSRSRTCPRTASGASLGVVIPSVSPNPPVGPMVAARFVRSFQGNVVIMATPDRDEIAGWFAGRLPDGWFTGAPSVTIDEGQIVVVGTLTEPEVPHDAPAQLNAGAAAGPDARSRQARPPTR